MSPAGHRAFHQLRARVAGSGGAADQLDDVINVGNSNGQTHQMCARSRALPSSNAMRRVMTFFAEVDEGG